VWVLGGRWILEALEEDRVSGPQFRYDATADTTFEQMDQLAQIVHATPHGRTAVVVSRLHAPRVAALAQRRALALTVLASEIDTEPPTGGPLAYFPAYVALRVSRDAIYEHAALRYYRMKGWID
jgi:hypothetical protein